MGGAQLILQQTGAQDRLDSETGELLLTVTEWMPMYQEILGGVPGGPFLHTWPADPKLARQMGLGPIGGGN